MSWPQEEVNHSDSRLEWEGQVRTDMFSGIDAEHIAELIDGNVWHTFEGFDAGIFITKH